MLNIHGKDEMIRILVGDIFPGHNNDDSDSEFTPGKRLLSFGAIGARRKFYKDFSNLESSTAI